jgi:predicted DNA binding CopG/RHH family protein
MAKKAALSAGWAGSTNPDRNDNLTSKSQIAEASKGQNVKVTNSQNKEDDRRRVTLRLTEDAWKQLKIMSIEEGCVAHKLLIEAVNDLFTKRGKPPIA